MMKRPLFLIASILILELVAVEQFTYAQNIIITKNDIGRAGTSIPVSAIGEPIGSVKLYAPVWVEPTDATPAHVVIEGSIFSVDPNGWPINFRVLLPASWSRRAIQSGGGGMNGSITVRTGRNPMINKGFAV
jgi:feruloyl esterase